MHLLESVEDILKFELGARDVEIIILRNQLEQAQNRIAELEQEEKKED